MYPVLPIEQIESKFSNYPVDQPIYAILVETEEDISKMIRITEPEKAKHSGNTREDLSYEAIVGALQAIMDCTGLITDYQRVKFTPKPLDEVQLEEVFHAIALTDYTDDPESHEKRRKVAELFGRNEEDIVMAYNADDY